LDASFSIVSILCYVAVEQCVSIPANDAFKCFVSILIYETIRTGVSITKFGFTWITRFILAKMKLSIAMFQSAAVVAF